jgi:UDP-glucuronate decarboxylase
MSVDDGRVVSNFIVQALSDIDITIYGNGSQTRSFCYVSDLVEGIYRCFMHKERLDIPVNLGNPVEISIVQLANAVISQTRSNSKVIYKELPEDDPKQRKPDTTLVEKLLNWKANVSLNDGLDLTIEYFRKQIEK